MASSQRSPTPPADVFDKDTLALHLRGLAHQATLFETQSLNQDAVAQILAEIRATNAAMETRINARMDEMKTAITERIDSLEEGMNNRFDKLESFAKNTKARANNARARELGDPYTPLVKEDGSAIRNFPRTFDEVNALSDTRVSNLLHAVGVEIKDGWNLAQKRSAFLGAIGAMQLPTL